MKLFEQEWEAWAAQCIAKDVSAANRETLRSVFYAGAMSWERLTLAIRLSNDHQAAANLVADLHEEMKAYVDELLRASGKLGSSSGNGSSNKQER